jgi:uncharacterized protein DUF6894
MSEVYFHCSDAENFFVDRRGSAMDLNEARDHAELLVRSLVMTPCGEDWRNWIVHVTDELGDELFALPFKSVLGKLH